MPLFLTLINKFAWHCESNDMHLFLRSDRVRLKHAVHPAELLVEFRENPYGTRNFSISIFEALDYGLSPRKWITTRTSSLDERLPSLIEQALVLVEAKSVRDRFREQEEKRCNVEFDKAEAAEKSAKAKKQHNEALIDAARKWVDLQALRGFRFEAEKGTAVVVRGFTTETKARMLKKMEAAIADLEIEMHESVERMFGN